MFKHDLRFVMGAHCSGMSVSAFDAPFQGYNSELSVAVPSADVPITHSGTDPESLCGDLKVVIGTSQMMKEDSTLVSRIAKFSDKCEREVRSRLSYGDAGSESSNRVMHVALLNGVAVGWCSSSPCSWGGDGHWGALSVDPNAQGKGVGSSLVEAAEKRLLDAGCETVQIEYRFTIGDEAKERLFAWYEGKLGFDGGPRRSGFRVCHKVLSAESFEAQHTKGVCATPVASTGPRQQPQHQHEAKRARALSTSSSASSYSASSISSGSRPASQPLRTLNSS